MLLISAVLLLKSFMRLSAVDLGFRPQNVLTLQLTRTQGNAEPFYSEVLDRLSALPEVAAAGAINVRPLSGMGWSQDITIEGRPPRPEGDYIWAAHREVSLGYFRAMQIPLLRGRSFVPTDRGKSFAIISETMARRYWPGEDPIGKRFGVNCSQSTCDWNLIVGVVADVKEVGAAAEPVTAMYFLGSAQDMTLVVRASQSLTSLVADVRSVIRSVDPNQPFGDIRAMRDIVSESVSSQRVTTLIAVLFAAISVLLASVGVYGVVSYSVAQQRHDFGVRMALGAAQVDLLKLVLLQGLKFIGIGVGAGTLTALVLTRFLSGLLYGVSASNPSTFLITSLALTALTLIASYIPARRAMRVDPAVTLRCE
jgi:putative ABC transport system permease protein